eukprot:4039870-Pleurochrysis_carterae.AAC.1
MAATMHSLHYELVDDRLEFNGVHLAALFSDLCFALLRTQRFGTCVRKSIRSQVSCFTSL